MGMNGRRTSQPETAGEASERRGRTVFVLALVSVAVAVSVLAAVDLAGAVTLLYLFGVAVVMVVAVLAVMRWRRPTRE